MIHIDRQLQTSNLDNCIFNILQAALLAKEAFGEQKLSVFAKSLDFRCMMYGSDVTDVIIIFALVCKECGRCPLIDVDWWVIGHGNMRDGTVPIATTGSSRTPWHDLCPYGQDSRCRYDVEIPQLPVQWQSEDFS